MSNRLDRQEATGRMLYMPGRGNMMGWPAHSGADFTAGTGVPINGIQGFAPGALFMNWLSTVVGGSIGSLFVNVGTFLSATWQPIDGTSLMAMYFGSGLAQMSTMGVLYEYADGTGINQGNAGAGQAANAGQTVLAVYSLPANSLDGLSSPQGSTFRGLRMRMCGNTASNTNSKTFQIVFNATTAVVGGLVTGGVVLATMTNTSSNVGDVIEGEVWKYGAANSNTQIYQQTMGLNGTTVVTGASKVLTTTATENAAILIAFTCNCVTTNTDFNMLRAEILGLN